MRKIFSGILVSIIYMMTFAVYAVNDVQNINTIENSTNNNTVENNTNQNLEELQGKKEEIEKEVESSKEELEEIDLSLSANLQEIAQMDINIRKTEITMKNINKEVYKAEQELKQVQQELNNITLDYNRKKELLDERLVAMYKSGETQYLDVLLQSKGLSDFISSYFLICEIIENDTRLLEEAQNTKNEIEIKRNEKLQRETQLNEQKQKYLMAQKIFNSNKVLRNTSVKNLSKQEKQIQVKIDEYNRELAKIENEIISLAKTASFGDDYKGGKMVWPIPNHYRITSKYGMRTHPITGVYKLHTGVDISAPKGTDFNAMAYGIVVKAEFNKAYGNMVILDHGGGVQTLYAHGTSIEVEVGQVVNAGHTVIKVGSTGYSTGPHAHFEIRLDGKTVNPLDYVSIPENEGN